MLENVRCCRNLLRYLDKLPVYHVHGAKWAKSLTWHAGDMAGNGEAGGPGPCEEHWHLQFQCQEDQGKVPLWKLNCSESKPPSVCKAAFC